MKNRYLVLLGLITLVISYWASAKTLPASLEVYQARTVIEKTEYKKVAPVVIAVLILETGWFADCDVENITAARITYLRKFSFPTDRKGFYEGLKVVPNSISSKPYAEDKNYIEKVKKLEERILASD